MPPVDSPDHILLIAFHADGDESSFACFVERHAGMVLGICRRVLGNGADAEDAAQVVFTVLAQKASQLTDHRNLAGWLHRVALHVAMRHKQAHQRRSQREAKVAAEAPSRIDHESSLTGELRFVLDQELDQLPDEYRDPLILHYFQGKSQQEAASQLGWTYGTVSGRLNRARTLLRERLERRGVAIGIGALMLMINESSAEVPSDFVASCVTTTMDRLTASGAHRTLSQPLRKRSSLAGPKATWFAAGLAASLVVLVSIGAAAARKSEKSAVPAGNGESDSTGLAIFVARATYIKRVLALDDSTLVVVAVQVDSAGASQLGFRLISATDGQTRGRPLFQHIPECSAVCNLVMQHSGKFVIAAVHRSRDRIRIARFDRDGSIDTTFGGNASGVVDLPMFPVAMDAPLGHIALDSQDRIVVTIRTEFNVSCTQRLDRDGRADPGFADHGVDRNEPCIALWNAIGRDDSIYVCGSATGKNFLFVKKLDANGRPDEGYGQKGGITAIDFGGLGVALEQPLMQADGKLLIGGERIETDFTFRPYLVQLDARGNEDVAFRRLLLESDRTFAGLALQGGKILLHLNHGSTEVVPETNAAKIWPGQSELLLLDRDGSVDPTFAENGVLTMPEQEQSTTVTPMSDGSFLTIGAQYENVPELSQTMRRFTKDGRTVSQTSFVLR